jgi:two-component system LytT family response regulator
MLRAFVVDDEPLAVQRMTRLLEATGRVSLAGSTTDPEAAIEYLNGHEIDVLFLDIEMPGASGFDLLERLERQPIVVFTTAYDQYAVNAFAVNSIDYLLKPVEADRLSRALDKIERLGGRTPTDVGRLARELATALAAARGRSPSAPLLRVASRVGDRTTILDVARVTHFVSRDKLTFAVSEGREHVIDHTLNELETRLDQTRFVRIHRATIVNLASVHELSSDGDGGVVVRLKDRATSLSVSRDRVRELKARLGI